MSKNSRNKGSAGERELLSILSAELGIAPIKRNLSQTRGGGADCIELNGWAIEIKRVERENLNAWWNQTVNQCRDGRKPVLFYRASRKPWQALMYLEDVNSDLTGDYTVALSFLGACMVIRESL